MSNTSIVLPQDISICQVAIMEDNPNTKSGTDFFPLGLGNKTNKGDAFVYTLPRHLGAHKLLITMKSKLVKKEESNEESK